MSTSFWCPAAPTTPAPNPLFGDEFFGEGQPEFVQQSTLPELNFSDANAKAILAVLGIDATQGAGEITVAQIPAMRATLTKHLLTVYEGRRSSLNSEDRSFKGTLAGALGVPQTAEDRTRANDVTAQIHHFGRSDEYLKRRLAELIDLMNQAEAGGYTIAWA